MAITITATDFKNFFTRGQFTFGTTLPAVRDADISEAISEALSVMNVDIYPDDATGIKALQYLTAHFLYLDINGGEGGGPIYNQTHREADDISETVSIPQWMKEGICSMFSTTFFGQKFLILTRPYTGGVVAVVEGGTQF